MPLYIKLDFGKDGNIHAWVNRDANSWSDCLSEVHASTAKNCLHSLARKLGSLENRKVEPK
jgi:hypothetical protein